MSVYLLLFQLAGLLNYTRNECIHINWFTSKCLLFVFVKIEINMSHNSVVLSGLFVLVEK